MKKNLKREQIKGRKQEAYGTKLRKAGALAAAGLLAVSMTACEQAAPVTTEAVTEKAAVTEKPTTEEAETTKETVSLTEAIGESSSAEEEKTEEGTEKAEQKTEEDEALSGASLGDGEVLRIGIIQMIENGAFNDMREGFLEELENNGYDESRVEIDYQCAQGDATNLQTIAQGMADGSYDLVCTIATPPTQAMVNLETETPVVFIAVSAPVAAGVITDMEKAPDKNATGTSNAIPVEDIFALCDELTPGCESFGLLYCTSEVNSMNTIEAAKEYLDAKGLSYVEAVVTNSSEVQQAAQSLVGEVDAIFIPNDSVIQSAMTLVSEIARDEKIPVYGSSATMVDSGCFATVAISDREIGAISAGKAIQILEGTPIEKVMAEIVPASDTVVNEDTLLALGIELPEDADVTLVKDAVAEE